MSSIDGAAGWLDITVHLKQVGGAHVQVRAEDIADVDAMLEESGKIIARDAATKKPCVLYAHAILLICERPNVAPIVQAKSPGIIIPGITGKSN